MRPFWFLPVVPRPDASYVAVNGVVLVVYFAFLDLEPSVAGLPTTAFHLATATFFFALVARNLILNHRLWEDRTRAIAAGSLGLALPWISLAILRAEGSHAIQIGVSVWLLVYAAIALSLLKDKAEDITIIPSIWAHDPDHGRMAVTMVALGDAAFAVTLAALSIWGSELAWIVALTAGSLALKFCVNWVIVLTIAARLDDD